ncbi:efflux RND transporter periplasmic adaptor subunit [Candidatus Nomurabacteria bacterium]|nr:efflux RND transporter periplasmic adaptor subunit [Candidatus Nomurabacteria bacterium]MCB9820363.1 efflux RND transporter periplasmic adaptor subunit [Candidatus Nomurabacteria bacterium]
MKNMFISLKDTVKGSPSYFRSKLRRKNIIIASVVVVLLVLIFGGKHKGADDNVEVVKQGMISKNVPATGEVVSDVNLSLSFQKSGKVEKVFVSSGEVVKGGTILASLYNAKEKADLAKAQANLEQAESDLDVLNTSLANAKKNLENTIKVQDALVSSAYRTLLSSDLEAIPKSKETIKTPPEVKGLYLGNVEGQYRVVVGFDLGSLYTNAVYTYRGLEDSEDSEDIILGKTLPLGTMGLSLMFPDDFTYSGYDTDWLINIPNKDGDSYVANYTAYESAKATRDLQISISQAEVDSIETELLSYTNTGTTPDILLAKADVANAAAILEDTYIRAPADGTVTRVDIEIGDIVQAFTEVVDLKDPSSLYVESYVNEASIVGVRPGLPVSISFDALGGANTYHGEVTQVDLSPKYDEGVVNYKVIVAITDDIPELRSGMTATLDIEVFKIDDALYVSKKVLDIKDGEIFVTRKNGDKKEEVKVTIGKEADGAVVEILSGLKAGDEIYLPK